jgi:hypothetical protein
MIEGGTVLGWVLTLAIDGAILGACAATMFFALRGIQAWLRRRETGDFATGVIILVLFCVLFFGAWLPVGIIMGTRSLVRRFRIA